MALISNNTFSQENNFEGELLYDFHFHDKTGKMSDFDSRRIMGNEQSYLFKGNKYKSEMNGEMNFTQFYHGGDTLYFSMNNTNAIFYTNSSNPDDTVISFNIKKEGKIIGAYACDLLEIISDAGITSYYFSNSLKTNPTFFKSHKKGLWSFFMEKTNGCLPVKIIADYKGSKTEILLKRVERRIVDNLYFEIPKGLPIIEDSN